MLKKIPGCKFAIILSPLVSFGLVSFHLFLFSLVTQDINFNDEISCSVKFLKATYETSIRLYTCPGWVAAFPSLQGVDGQKYIMSYH